MKPIYDKILISLNLINNQKYYKVTTVPINNLQEAEEAALVNGLTVVGEFVEIVVDEGSMHYMKNNFSLQERTLH